MEWIIPMIAGLLLDILGVFLIVRPFLRLRLTKYTTVYVGDGQPIDPLVKIKNDITDIEKELRDDFSFKLKNRHYIKSGFIVTSFGFGLIMLASLLNYYE